MRKIKETTMIKLEVKTDTREQMVDITPLVAGALTRSSVTDGALLVYCPHTTGAVTVNEGADPDVQRDITSFMNRLVPRTSDFRHAEGNSDAHIKSSLFGCEQMVMVEEGRPSSRNLAAYFFLRIRWPERPDIVDKIFPHAGIVSKKDSTY